MLKAPEKKDLQFFLWKLYKCKYLISISNRFITACLCPSCMLLQIKDVRDHQKEDRMESFFLAETTKYLYLLFDTDNFIHNRGQHGMVVSTPWGECVLEAGGYIFNTG